MARQDPYSEQMSERVGARPVPVANAYTRPFWEGARSGELRLPRCSACRQLFYPPPPRCPRCLASALEWVRLSGRGRIAAWTTVHLATVPGVTPPFTVGEVELEEQAGLIVVALLAPPTDTAAIGCPVAIAFTEKDAAGIRYPEFRIIPRHDGAPRTGRAEAAP
jgi:uncharacterized protein